MSTWQVEVARPEHIPYLAAGMRAADRREVWSSDRWLPEEALKKSLMLSTRAWTCFVDGLPACMWGVAHKGSIFSETGVPWLLGTDAIYGISRTFVRHSRDYIAKMHVVYPYLENYVHADNRLSIRWLAWCGFVIERETPRCMNGEDFYYFWRKQHV